MKYPKFIITKEGHFRLGMVNLHEHLLKPGDHCLGGGFYEFDYTNNRILLDRESYDFGPPLWDMITVLRVPSAYRGMQIIYRDHHKNNLIVSDSKTIYYV